MDYHTGVCTLEFKPDHSDLGNWMCKFTVPDTDEEIGSATVVLLNSLGGEYYWISLCYQTLKKKDRYNFVFNSML